MNEHEALARLCELKEAHPEARVVTARGPDWSVFMAHGEIWFSGPVQTEFRTRDMIRGSREGKRLPSRFVDCWKENA